MLLVFRYLTGKQLGKPCVLLFIGCLMAAATTSAQCLSIRRSGNVVQAKNVTGAIEIKNPEKIKAADDDYATARPLISIGLGNEIPTQELEIKDFNFSIPEPSVICGVEVRIKRRATSFLGISIGSAGPKDKQVMLLKNGSVQGVNTAKGSLWSADDAYTLYGGNGGTWGTTLTTADVNSPNFGVSLALSFTALISVSVMPSAEIDHVAMEVFYQPAVVLPIQLNQFKASLSNEKINLDWKITNQEAGTSIFIQRSEDARNWKTIRQLYTNPTQEAYSYSDQPEKKGTYFYRLQLVSPAGRIQYSKELSINWSTLGQHTFFMQQGHQLLLKRPTSNSRIYLFNSNGQPVDVSIFTSNQNTIIDISRLATGVYILQVDNQVQKFLKR